MIRNGYVGLGIEYRYLRRVEVVIITSGESGPIRHLP